MNVHTLRSTMLAAALSLCGTGMLLATPAPPEDKADQDHADKSGKKDKGDKEKDNQDANKNKGHHGEQPPGQVDKAQRQADRDAQQQADAARQAEHRQQVERQQQHDAQAAADAARAANQQARAQAEQQAAQQHAADVQRQQNREARTEANQVAIRLSQDRQQELIRIQRQRATAYDQRLQQQELLLQQRNEALRASNRLAQYRYQQQYLDQLRQQRQVVQRGYDYGNDPYYYTAPTYRYSRAGRSYEVNQYAADMLKQAVNDGYAQGVRAGQADREDRWSSARYQDSYAYQDATYGYNGAYVDVSEYQYYFRQGFQRGYQDGHSSRYQYGVNTNGQSSLLTKILGSILSLQSLR